MYRSIEDVKRIALDRYETVYRLHYWELASGIHGSNIEWIMEGFVEILEAIDAGYLCFCGKFNTDDDMCNHSPDDEEEWREENGQTEADRD
tara:strand:- start:6152 stop:6424 length:273 start_codon:yes stop_codon:yes gene_type:complete